MYSRILRELLGNGEVSGVTIINGDVYIGDVTIYADGYGHSDVVLENTQKLEPKKVRGQLNTSSYNGLDEYTQLELLELLRNTRKEQSHDREDKEDHQAWKDFAKSNSYNG